MLLSKEDFTRILVHGLPLNEGDPAVICKLHCDDINNIKKDTIECFPDSLADFGLRVCFFNKEVLNLSFTKDRCFFKSCIPNRELLSYRTEIYQLILRMVAFENARSLPKLKKGKKLVLKSTVNYSKKQLNANTIDKIMTKKSLLAKANKKKYKWN